MTEDFNPFDFIQNGFNGKRSPLGSHNHMSNQDFSWINDYVKKIIENAVPGHVSEMQKKHPGENVFETHHYIIVRMPLPKDTHFSQPKVFLQHNELKIEGVTEQTKKITLPANGLYKGSKAVIKEGVLEVRIPKRSGDDFKEIDVRYM